MPEKLLNIENKVFSLEQVEHISESLLAQVKKMIKIEAVEPIEVFSNIIYDFNWVGDENQDPHNCNIFYLNISHSFIQIMNICPFNTDLMQFGNKVIVSRILVLLLLLNAIDVLESTKIPFKDVWGHTNDSMFGYMEKIFTTEVFVRDEDELITEGSNDFTMDYFKFISSRKRLKSMLNNELIRTLPIMTKSEINIDIFKNLFKQNGIDFSI